jgi:hypothetical protein
VRLAVTFTIPEVGKRCSWRGELDSFDLGADTTTPARRRVARMKGPSAV